MIVDVLLTGVKFISSDENAGTFSAGLMIL